MPSSQPIRSARGVRDLLPAEMAAWNRVLRITREVVEGFGYREIATPIIEAAELVERVGESTDIVQREMYRFQDVGGRWLVLRPEGTAGVVRAYFQGHLDQGPQPARLWLAGPMFRYGRPQAGRYRQFAQLDLEVIGDPSAAVDAELIEVFWRWLEAIGITPGSVQLNSIGDDVCRPAYREALLAYYRPLADQLCPDCRRRLELNPLRLLDCKEEADQRFKAGAPRVTDHLCEPCRLAFAEVRALLEAAGIPYQLNPELVRGLDYYTRTTFEVWPPGPQAAQSALGGGGRYDGLAAELGYPACPGVGFAAGLDRVMALLGADSEKEGTGGGVEVLVLPEGAGLAEAAAEVGRACRRTAVTAVDYTERSLRAKMRSANHAGVAWVVLFNAEEAARRVVQLRDMASGAQVEAAWGDLPGLLGAVG